VSRKKVLYVLHNHPALSPGGTEAYAMQVYERLRESGPFEPILLARASEENSGRFAAHLGTPFVPIGDDPNQFLFFVEPEQYDIFFMRSKDKSLVKPLAAFLRAHAPDVVHFQHTLFMGSDLISTVRRTLPRAPIVYTLHEYTAICHHYGQMVRTTGEGLCSESSPRRCNQCFPEHSPQEFFLRSRFIQGQFNNVDLFIAPSRFLLERYVDWGIPRDRIRHEEHGFPPVVAPPPAPGSRRNRFGFFGVLTPFKGVDVLLRAMEMLGPTFDGHLWIHGANYQHQPEDTRAELERLFDATRQTVTNAGPYDHDADLTRLMSEIDWVVVPSIWWENAPLVIMEAFQRGRPVICSDVGALAEKVRHDVDGLHFSVGSPGALAATLDGAVRWPALWERLHEGVPAVRSVEEHVGALTEIYDRLIATRAGGPEIPQGGTRLRLTVSEAR
jgi:glycosyltransferase involved in cell wall biosynthesis